MKQLIVMAMAATAFATVYAQDADTDREVRRWNLTSVSTQDVTNIKADANWKIDSKSRYCYLQALDNAPLTANGTELETTKNLTFTVTANSNGNVRLGGSTGPLWLVMPVP